ncbi:MULTISPECIES: cytochrome P450 [Kitasatospora]|uniref:Cytochrome P450 n=1 Tax=Kitasatospora cathayae TaxID=3004092 RepID=A0ABY7PXZ8_9ACTN|nr:cytochrome P450 [Kitasatospora sp. HUAS 3-15]WBP85308.1 cytochrome P450 [Kitasatospora sp. HUAS 3-15]
MSTENSATGAGTGTAPLPPMHCLRHLEPGPPRLAALPTGTPVWLVSRHADVRQVLTDPRLGRAPLYAPDAPPLMVTPNILDDPQSMLNIDGTEHQRLRRTVQRAFTPRAIARWKPWVASVVESLIDELIDRGSPADIVAAYSRPLPVAVISRLMGLDNLDSKRLAHWSDHALSTTAFSAEAIGTAMTEFAAFGAEVIAERRADPGEDLVSSLLAAAAEDGSITEGQLVALVIGLVVAGHETTMTSLGNALVYLLQDGRDAWQRLASDEASAAAATEQILRAVPLGDVTEHMPGLLRRTVEDVEIGGVVIPAGSVVAADTGAANQDPEVFTGDLRTELFSPLAAPMLTFGAGPHHCLGAWLARMELELALHRLARRLPALRMADPVEDVDWRRGLLTRSPDSLRVIW